MLRFPAAAAPVSSVSRPSSHDFSFCLSDSFKQKHTSKAPQRGSSLNFSDFWFSYPFFPPPLFLPFSSVMLVLKSLEWHGDRSDGPSTVLRSSQSWKLPLPLLVSHKVAPRAARAHCMGWLQKHYKEPVTNRSLCSPCPKTDTEWSANVPHHPATPSSHPFPVPFLLPPALLGITAQN